MQHVDFRCWNLYIDNISLFPWQKMKAEQAIVCGIVRTIECKWQCEASLRAQQSFTSCTCFLVQQETYVSMFQHMQRHPKHILLHMDQHTRRSKQPLLCMELLLPLLHSLDEQTYFQIIMPTVSIEERKLLNGKPDSLSVLNISSVLRNTEALYLVKQKQ